MQPDRWRHLQDIYFRALEMPAMRRSLFLDTTCQNDPAMRQEVESLLECEDKIGQFLEALPADALPVMTAVDSHAESAGEETLVLDDFIGKVIDDRYVVTQRVGAGGMGVVYRADHRILGTPVAIKRLGTEFRERKEFRKQAVDEARRAVQLDHENVSRIKDVVEEPNEVFLVMEFIDGHTLRTYLGRPLDIDAFLGIATQCASALVAAHEKRIAHLDIKPANIMLTESGHVKICDFGVARQLPSPENAHVEEARWSFGGTPAYMAPEVLEGNQFDVRADIFSLGVVFYELLSGTHPFHSINVRATTNRILKETPPPLRTVIKKLPARLIALIERMLSKDAGSRPAASETLDELQTIQLRRRFLREAWRTPGKAIPLVRKRPAAAFSVLMALALIVMGMSYINPRAIFGLNRLPAVKRVAILPFHLNNLSRDSFAKGVAEMLTYRLGDITAVPDILIEPPSRIRELRIDSVEKARVDLGASLVVDGRFDFSGRGATFYYSFIRTEDNQTLRWGSVVTTDADAESFVRDIIREVSAQLEVHLQPTPGPGTGNREAFSTYREGMGLLSQYHNPENLEAAVQHFNQAVAKDPKFAAAYAALGEAYWYQFQERNKERALLEKSKFACEKADSLVLGQSEPQICLGRVYQAMGDRVMAAGYFRQALQYSPANGKALELLGLTLEDRHDEESLDEAEKVYLLAITLRSDDWAPESWIAGFYDQTLRDYPKALQHYQKALNKSKDNGRVYYSMASAYKNLGKYDDAVKSLQESARLRPWAPRPASNLGLAYLMWRHHDEDAVRELENAFTLEKPDDLGTNYIITGNLARIYELTRQHTKAREKYKLAIEQGLMKLEGSPGDHRVHILLGRYYAALGQTNDAKRYLNLALKARPEDPHYLLIAATAYVALHEPQNALACIEKAIQQKYTKVQIDAERELDALKDEPKYKTLMKSLEQAQ